MCDKDRASRRVLSMTRPAAKQRRAEIESATAAVSRGSHLKGFRYGSSKDTEVRCFPPDRPSHRGRRVVTMARAAGGGR